MTTVYATDIRKKRKVRYMGVVHYVGTEIIPDFSMGAMAPHAEPYGTRCGARFDNGETPVYLENADDVVVTCVACLGDRRGRG